LQLIYQPLLEAGRQITAAVLYAIQELRADRNAAGELFLSEIPLQAPFAQRPPSAIAHAGCDIDDSETSAEITGARCYPAIQFVANGAFWSARNGDARRSSPAPGAGHDPVICHLYALFLCSSGFCLSFRGLLP
jgi:hypothetical protein